MSDKRVGNGAGRTRRSGGATRRSRAAIRAGDAKSRDLSDEDRVEEFRRNLFQSVLPDLPPIPGFHTVWLTTSNPRDSIAARVRLGYRPIEAHEVPGGEYMTMKTGEYPGCIGVNEMIAYKIPLHLYEEFMRHNHHEQPLHEEGKLSMVREVIEAAAASAAKSGRRGVKVELEDGTAELGSEPEVPSFEHTLTTREAPRA